MTIILFIFQLNHHCLDNDIHIIYNLIKINFYINVNRGVLFVVCSVFNALALQRRTRFTCVAINHIGLIGPLN